MAAVTAWNTVTSYGSPVGKMAMNTVRGRKESGRAGEDKGRSPPSQHNHAATDILSSCTGSAPMHDNMRKSTGSDSSKHVLL